MFISQVKLHTWFTAIVGAALLVAGAHAATVQDLYEVTVPIQGSSDRGQDAAFAEALSMVIVRVTGQRGAPQQVSSGLGNARRYVQKFGKTERGELRVGFDPIAVEQLLNETGLPIWGRERPATLACLLLENSGGQRELVTAESSHAEREIVAQAARARGLPLVWPRADALDRSALEIACEASAAESLKTLAPQIQAQAVLAGNVRREASGNATVHWRLVFNDEINQVTGSLTDGVHLAADQLAKLFAAGSASVSEVVVDVTGISDLNAYAGALNYLDGLSLVRGVLVEQFSGDVMRLRLRVRGEEQVLRRALALDDRLLPNAAEASGVLSLRYQP